MPMPVSVTEIATTWSAAFSTGWSKLHPPSTRSARSVTAPFSVNLKALDRRFRTTCCRRLSSVHIEGGRSGSTSIEKLSSLSSATWLKVRSIRSRRSEKNISPMSSVTVPDSILDRSRMSLISDSRSDPPAWMVRAKLICLSVRLPSTFSASRCDSISRLFSGVRSSCDMLARNSDL